MHAAILSIGDELTLGQCLDTNSMWLSSELAALGIITTEHRTIEDEAGAITDAVLELSARVRVLILTGGLGPTGDDQTRPGLGGALDPGQELVVDEQAVKDLAQWFVQHGIGMPESNQVQTLRPPSAHMLANPHGTAPGLAGRRGECLIFALPGPPREMKPMFDAFVRPELQELEPGQVLIAETVLSFGIGEALAAEKLGGLLSRDGDSAVGITAGQTLVTARVRCRGNAEPARAIVQQQAEEIERLWFPFAFGRGGDTLPAVVGSLLSEKKCTLSVAESCTGGWLSKLIVDAPGSSNYFLGGYVTYTNDMKHACLDVPEAIFASNGPGAVSLECAEAMARGVIAQTGSQYSLAITGIAGPGGGVAGKPVGTIFIALGRKEADSESVLVRRFEFRGERDSIRHRSAMSALQMLRLTLIDADPDLPLLWSVDCSTAPAPERANS